MTGRDIFKIWAPEKAKWTNWVRPVPFVEINENFEGYEVNNFTIPSINYIKKYSPNVAIFIDLPGDNSIKEGIAISKLGFRPIPIYNGTDEQEGAISRILLVFDQETYQEETARTYLEQLLSIFLTDSERISEIVQQLIVFDEEEESLIVNDIVEDHYEFFTRIDQPKEKIVFYINDLNFE